MAKRATLTGKQQAFVNAYILSHFNATEAARQAGYGGGDDGLRVIGCKNLANDNIRAAIDKRMTQLKMGDKEVLARLSFIASGSMEDFIDPDSMSIDLRKAKRAEKLGLIKKFKITTVTTSHADRDTQTETIEFELHDAMRALEMLGKHHKVFERAGETDWQAALKAAGIDPDRLVDDLSEEFMKHMKAKESVKNDAE